MDSDSTEILMPLTTANGSVKKPPPKTALVVGAEEALRLILATEAAGEMDDNLYAELPVIIREWLMSPRSEPRLLKSHGYPHRERLWSRILRKHILLKHEKIGLEAAVTCP